MAEIVKMPKLSDTMEEGVVASWIKKEGDTVKEGDLLAEIETDKATMEYEAPASGTILRIVVPPGTKLSIGEPICVIGAKGEAFELESGSAPAPKPAQEVVTAAAPASTGRSTAAAPTASAKSTKSGSERVLASPLAKKLAKDKGVDIANVAGTGPNGRVVARDIQGASATAAPARALGGFSAAEDRIVPASMMRQTIAKRLHAAKNDAPHFYLTRSVDMGQVLAWRERINADTKAVDFVKVSVNDIVMMATARALRSHPGCNSSWQGDSIREYSSVHMSMAVALPTGLITPVIRNCDQLGVRDIARQSKELAERAKQGSLKPEDYTGGTFTISNLGMLGIEEFTAIINPPQAAILAVGATMPVPWVNGAGEVVVAKRMKITLSCDHRVIDGAQGALFLHTLVANLEDPLSMLC